MEDEVELGIPFLNPQDPSFFAGERHQQLQVLPYVLFAFAVLDGPENIFCQFLLQIIKCDRIDTFYSLHHGLEQLFLGLLRFH